MESGYKVFCRVVNVEDGAAIVRVLQHNTRNFVPVFGRVPCNQLEIYPADPQLSLMPVQSDPEKMSFDFAEIQWNAQCTCSDYGRNECPGNRFWISRSDLVKDIANKKSSS